MPNNYHQFLHLLNNGAPSADYGWLDKDYIKVVHMNDELRALLEAVIPDLWLEDSDTVYYNPPVDEVDNRFILDHAFNNGYKFIIMEHPA